MSVAPNPRPRVSIGQRILDIEGLVRRQLTLVQDAVRGATEVLLSGDVWRAAGLVDADAGLDQLVAQTETAVESILLLEAPMARDFRFVVGVGHLVPEFERTGDLATHISREAADHYGAALTPRLRELVRAIGDDVELLWAWAADVFLVPGLHTGDEALAIDRRVDANCAALVDVATVELTGRHLVRAGLLARYYERIGDHAVNVIRRLEREAPSAP